MESLPEQVAEWQAVEVFVCQQCLAELREAVWKVRSPKNPNARMFYLKEGLQGDECAIHRSPVQKTRDLPVDFLVQKVLPPGTEFLEKWYRRSMPLEDRSGRDLFVTVVTSGADKRSIHRPERCFQGQGWQIVLRDRLLVPVSLGSTKELEVTRLLVRRVWLTAEGQKGEAKEVVFYWFMARNRLTGRNLKRLLYTAGDRIFRGLNYRWSCVQVNSPIEGSVGETSEELARFVSRLLPMIYGGSREQGEGLRTVFGRAPGRERGRAGDDECAKKK